jgi:hypothetical protein
MKRLTGLTGESWKDYLWRAEVSDGASTQQDEGRRRKPIPTAAASSHLKEPISKLDEDTSLAVNGATDVTSFADVSRVFNAAVGYPAATSAGESVYPVSG